jgi:hypothetical protein
VVEPERVRWARTAIVDGVGYADRCRAEYLDDTFERKLRYLVWLN